MKKSPSSTSSAESAASHTPSNDSAQQELFGQLPSVSENHIAKPSSESTGPTRQSSTMSAPSTQMDLEELTSFAAASHASLGPKPGSGAARKMTETSGRKWLALLQSYGLNILLARTCAALLTSRWASNAAYLTWKASATKPSHLLFRLVPSMPRTDGTGSGLWPTAQAWDGKRGARKPDGKRGMALSDLCAPQMWPTPQHRDFRTGEAHRYTDPQRSQDLNDAVAFWPTPVARDYKGQGMSRERQETREPDNLCSWTAKYEGSGALNPEWVEWLMGFPVGWTSLTAEELQAVSKTECRGSKPSETPSSRKSSRKSGGRSSQRSAGDE